MLFTTILAYSQHLYTTENDSRLPSGIIFLGQSDFVDAIKHFLCQREHSAFYSAHRFGIDYILLT